MLMLTLLFHKLDIAGVQIHRIGDGNGTIMNRIDMALESAGLVTQFRTHRNPPRQAQDKQHFRYGRLGIAQLGL